MDQQCSAKTGGHIRGLHSGGKSAGHPAYLCCSRRGWGGWLVPARGLSPHHCVLVWGRTLSPAGHPQTSAARNDIWKAGRRLVRPSSGGTHTPVKSALFYFMFFPIPHYDDCQIPLSLFSFPQKSGWWSSRYIAERDKRLCSTGLHRYGKSQIFHRRANMKTEDFQ